MVKTGGEGGKGQTVRSGGGKGPAFEGGQTAWARRLPHRRGYSQKARDTRPFRRTARGPQSWSLGAMGPAVEITPESLKERGLREVAARRGEDSRRRRKRETLPAGLRLRDLLFSQNAREALLAAGAPSKGITVSITFALRCWCRRSGNASCSCSSPSRGSSS